jgi:hypothetical protein
MTSVTSRLVLTVLAATLFLVPGCVQPGGIDDPSTTADAAPDEQADAAPQGNPPPPNGDQPDAEPPPAAADPTFAADVYPLLQANSLTCGNCHKAGGIASFMPFDDGASVVYGRLMTGGQRVNVGSPEASLILQKPLAGSAQSHRIKIFQSTADLRYQLILKWIQQGAQP